MKLRLMLGWNLWSLAAFLIAQGFSLPALAATYSFASGSNPPCSGTWSVSGSVYSCSGKLTLATGDSIVPASSITIKATSGIVFAGNNTVGSSTATVDLENNYGGIQVSGTSTIFGGLKNTSGALTLSNTVVKGGVSSASGGITITGGEVAGLISSGCCAVNVTNANLSGGASSPNTVSITGGVISGNFYSGGGSGVVMSGVQMLSGSITTGSVAVTISNSTIGTPENPVDINSGNHLYLRNDTVVYGSIVSPNWGQHIEDTSRVYGSCTPTNVKCNAMNCSPYKGSFYVNEANTKDDWVEIYAKNPSTISNWTLTACSVNNKGAMVCESQSLSYNQAADGLFKIVNFSLDMHVKAADFLLKDNSGKLVDYFRVGMELDSNPLQSATAEQCGLLNSCNTLVRGNSGQRNFARMPDGGCSWEESNWQDDTKDDSNDGGAGGLNHIRVFLNNDTGALTCSPRPVSAIACADASCSARFGSSVSVTLAPGGAAATIPASGTGTPTVSSTSTGVRSITLAASTPATVGTPGFRCYGGTVAAPGTELTGACNVTFADSGFVLSIPGQVPSDPSLPHHRACTDQTLSVKAVRKDDSSKQCVPGFANVTRNVAFSRTYLNPGSGSVNPVLGGASLNGAATIPLTFDANGVAQATFNYADAGQLRLAAAYSGSAATGDSGLAMTGSLNVIVAPERFAVAASLLSGETAYVAGKPFALTVTAMNACATPAATPNFGRETTPVEPPLLSHTRVAPSDAAAVNGSVSATLAAPVSGAYAANDAKWTEVGEITLAASVANYLGSGLDVSGTSANTGPFRPDHFVTTVSHGCAGSTFTYSGQPFKVSVTAHEAGGGVTKNYYAAASGSSFSRDVSLTDAKGVAGTLDTHPAGIPPPKIPASSFVAGEAEKADLVFTFTQRLTKPSTIALRGVDADGVSSAGFETAGETPVYAGRLRLVNAFGTVNYPPPMEAWAQVWSGSSWVKNSLDTCTLLENEDAAVVLSPSDQATASVDGANGDWRIRFASAKKGAATVCVDLDRAASVNDATCAAGSTVRVDAPWLQYQGLDPRARVSFGVYPAETQRTIHLRELY